MYIKFWVLYIFQYIHLKIDFSSYMHIYEKITCIDILLNYMYKIMYVYIFKYVLKLILVRGISIILALITLHRSFDPKH